MDQNTTQPADRHLQRAEAMIAQGIRPCARLYLAILARSAHARAHEHRSNLLGDRLLQVRIAEAHELHEQRYREAHERFGFGPIAAAAPGEVNPAVHAAELAAEEQIEPVDLMSATLAYEVRSAYWPSLRGFGIHILCEDRSALGRGYYLEAQIHPPDLARTQINLRRAFPAKATDGVGFDRVRTLAGRWAALGFAILAAESALQDREGVVFAIPAAPTPEVRL